MCKGCRIIKAKALKDYSCNPRSSMTVYEAKTRAKTPCTEESETTALVFLLKEYWSPDWSPKQGRVSRGHQNLYRIKAFDSKINKKGD